MTKSQKVALIGLGVAVGVGITGAEVVGAANGERNYPPMIESIIEKYNLNDDEVHDFMEENRDELRAERRATRESKFAENLSSAIEEGKLTQEQADAWTEKHEEFKAQREEMEQWMEEQGIDPDIFPQREGFGRKGEGQGPHQDQ